MMWQRLLPQPRSILYFISMGIEATRHVTHQLRPISQILPTNIPPVILSILAGIRFLAGEPEYLKRSENNNG